MNLKLRFGAPLVLAGLAGCGWSIGSTSRQQILKTTVGQELIDLKKARDTGALSEGDYAKKKKEIIDAALASK
jgi:hypothetical protein